MRIAFCLIRQPDFHELHTCASSRCEEVARSRSRVVKQLHAPLARPTAVPPQQPLTQVRSSVPYNNILPPTPISRQSRRFFKEARVEATEAAAILTADRVGRRRARGLVLQSRVRFWLVTAQEARVNREVNVQIRCRMHIDSTRRCNAVNPPTCCSSFLNSSIFPAIHRKLCVPRPLERFFARSATLALVVLNLAISVSSARTCCSDFCAWNSSHSRVSKFAVGERSLGGGVLVRDKTKRRESGCKS